MRKNHQNTTAFSSIYAKRYFINIGRKKMYRKMIKKSLQICSFENYWLHLSRIIKGKNGLANRVSPPARADKARLIDGTAL